MTSEVIGHIVTQTNPFAAQRSSPLLGWEICTEEGLKSWLSRIGIVMAIRQFRALLSNLHFKEKSTAVPRGQPGYDRLHKVRPILQMVAHNCSTVYQGRSKRSGWSGFGRTTFF